MKVMKKSFISSNSQCQDPPTGYFNSTTKVSIKDHKSITTQDLSQQIMMNASLFDVSNSIFKFAKVRGLGKSFNYNTNLKQVFRPRRTQSYEAGYITSTTKTSRNDNSLPKIKLKTKNGYVDVPLNQDYLFKPSKNHVRDAIKLRDKISQITSEIKLNEDNLNINHSRLNDNDVLLNKNNRDYFNILYNEREEKMADYDYSIYDYNKKKHLRGQSNIDDDMKRKIEEKLEELDLCKEEDEEMLSMKRKSELTKIKMQLHDAKLFKDMYLKAGEEYLCINNRLTYPSSFEDSKSINYLFNKNIEKMNWDLR